MMKAGEAPDKQSGNVILILLHCYSAHNLGGGERPRGEGGCMGRGTTRGEERHKGQVPLWWPCYCLVLLWAIAQQSQTHVEVQGPTFEPANTLACTLNVNLKVFTLRQNETHPEMSFFWMCTHAEVTSWFQIPDNFDILQISNQKTVNQKLQKAEISCCCFV